MHKFWKIFTVLSVLGFIISISNFFFMVFFLNILISYTFFNLDKLSQIMIYTSITYLCFQFFMIVMLEASL